MGGGGRGEGGGTITSNAMNSYGIPKSSFTKWYVKNAVIPMTTSAEISCNMRRVINRSFGH